MNFSRFTNKLVQHTLKCEKLYSTQQPQASKYPRRVFSGIQPTGQIHLGNYLGAISQWVKLQNENEDMILSLVDLHSITLPQDPKILSRNIIEMAATLLACGINPDKVTLFQQSSVPAHTHLMWCLGCISTMARLAHLPAYKEKSAGLKDVPLGLFIYPVLQAADILAYKATHVPVGEDQAQHIELSQDLARMFNNRFGDTFPIPHCIYTTNEFSRLKSLRDPSKKMSKSDPDPKSRICLTDSPDDIAKKIKKTVTDCNSEVSYDPVKRPGVSNLISIHSFMTGKSISEICEEAHNVNTGVYKSRVADAIIAHLQPVHRKMSQLLDNVDYVENVLKAGAEKCVDMSEGTMEEVKEKMGFKSGMQSRRKDNVKLF